MSSSASSAQNDANESKKPIDSDFYQQRLRAWQPLLTPPVVIIIFAIVGIVFCIIGAVILTTTNSVITYSQQYDSLGSNTTNSQYCQHGTKCATLTITSTMSPPIFFYYELHNFYQNHRRYVKSRSDPQLQDASNPSLSSCDPLQQGQNNLNLYPCGLVAYSFFNDTFAAKIVDANGAVTDLSQNLDPANPMWQKNGIAWASDRDYKFKNNTDVEQSGLTRYAPDGVRMPDVTDEDLMVWMRTAALPTFKKLYRIINTSIEAGTTMYVSIVDQYPVSDFNGAKYIVISTSSWLGGKNLFLGWAYVTIGLLCVIIAIMFGLKQLIRPRPLGDLKYFKWSGTKNTGHANAAASAGNGGGNNNNTRSLASPSVTATSHQSLPRQQSRRTGA